MRILFLIGAAIVSISTSAMADTWYIYKHTHRQLTGGDAGACYCYSITRHQLTAPNGYWLDHAATRELAEAKRARLIALDRNTCPGRCSEGGSTNGGSSHGHTLGGTQWEIRDFGRVGFNSETKGTYTATGGGAIYGERVDDFVFVGTWAQRSAQQKCSTRRHGSYYWGEVEYRFSSDFRSVTGSWNRCGDGRNYPISGVRKTRALGPSIGKFQHADWYKSSSDFATVKEDLVFNVGTGDNPKWGFGYASVELTGVQGGMVEIYKTPKNFGHHDQNAFAGFVIDYHTGAGYSHRVMLGVGRIDKRRNHHDFIKGIGRPGSIKYHDLGRSNRYPLDFRRWAPPNWDGTIMFTVGIQNTGRNSQLKAKLDVH
jgi:hypothetical protein